jgi:hypothetical protein
MKIVIIFAEKLYSFHYTTEEDNEYDRLMDLWTDVSYLRTYAIQNKIGDIRAFVEQITDNAAYIEDLLKEMTQRNRTLASFFKRLDDMELGTKILSLQKGKRYQLRIYAIKIDENLFVITGGAIKLGWKMQDHPDTQNEKIKLDQAKNYLKRNGVFDSDSFYELINEANDE